MEGGTFRLPRKRAGHGIRDGEFPQGLLGRSRRLSGGRFGDPSPAGRDHSESGDRWQQRQQQQRQPQQDGGKDKSERKVVETNRDEETTAFFPAREENARGGQAGRSPGERYPRQRHPRQRQRRAAAGSPAVHRNHRGDLSPRTKSPHGSNRARWKPRLSATGRSSPPPKKKNNHRHTRTHNTVHKTNTHTHSESERKKENTAAFAGTASAARNVAAAVSIAAAGERNLQDLCGRGTVPSATEDGS
mmetsp:Transcript_21289/g.44828  ORF Transcript_21289/g.44828 Transcript_21289/m.44828 type:complete len:246 (-) Transcript_21289:125-862(-)